MFKKQERTKIKTGDVRTIEIQGLDFKLQFIRRADGTDALCHDMSISDLHLGTFMAYAGEQAHMLSHVQPRRLWLVGDIVDLEAMKGKRRFKFPDNHWLVLASLFKLAHQGADVTYIPGNHEAERVRGKTIQQVTGTDKHHRRATGRTLFGVKIEHTAEYITADGKKGLVEHGDARDPPRIKALYGIGNAAYELVARLDKVIHHQFVQTVLQCISPPLAERAKHFSPARAAKHLIKDFINKHMGVLSGLETWLRDSPYTFILYGHTHMPGIVKVVTEGGTKYIINDGCGTEGVSAALFDADGKPAIMRWCSDRIEVTDADGTTKTVVFADYGIKIDPTHHPITRDVNTGQASHPFVQPEYFDRTARVLRVIRQIVPGKERLHLLAQYRQARREVGWRQKQSASTPQDSQRVINLRIRLRQEAERTMPTYPEPHRAAQVKWRKARGRMRARRNRVAGVIALFDPTAAEVFRTSVIRRPSFKRVLPPGAFQHPPPSMGELTL